MQTTMRENLPQQPVRPRRFEEHTSFNRTNMNKQMLKTQRSQPAMATKAKPPPINIPPQSFVKHTVVDNITNASSVSVTKGGDTEEQATQSPPGEARGLKHAKTQFFRLKTSATDQTPPILKHSKTQVFPKTSSNQSTGDAIAVSLSYDPKHVVQSLTTEAEPTKPVLKRSKTQILRDAFKAMKDDQKDVAGDGEVVASTVKGWLTRLKSKRAEKQRQKAKKALTAGTKIQLDQSSSIQSTPQQIAPDGGIVLPNSKSEVAGTKGKTFEDRVQKMLHIYKEKKKAQKQGKVTKAAISGPTGFVRGVSAPAKRLVPEQQTLTLGKNAAMQLMPDEKRMNGLYTDSPSNAATPGPIGLGIYINENQDNGMDPKWIDLADAQMREQEKHRASLEKLLDNQEAMQSTVASKRKAPRPAIPEPKETLFDDTASNITRWSDFMAKAKPAPAHPVPQMPVFAPKSTVKPRTLVASSAVKPSSSKGKGKLRNPFEFEPEDDYPLPSGSPTLGNHRDSWEDDSATSNTGDYHNFLARVKAERNPPSPSVYSTKTRATTKTAQRKKVRHLSTWDSGEIDQRTQYEKMLGADLPAYQPPMDVKGKGKAKVSSERENTSVRSYAPVRAGWKKEVGIGKENEYAKQTVAKEKQPTMRNIVQGLKIDDEEDEDVDRNTEYYGFYDDILRTPAVPQRKNWD